MRFFLFFLAFCLPLPLFAADAPTRGAFDAAAHNDWPAAISFAASGESALKKTISWLYYRDPEGGAKFRDIAAFMRANPGWPQQKQLQLRAEQSLRVSEVSDDELAAWFKANPPVSGAGKVAYAELLTRSGQGTPEQLQFLIRDAWRNGDFDANEEQRLFSTYGTELREQDHILRADRLLWEEKIPAARRMLPLLPESQQAVADARIALMQDDKAAPGLVARVPSTLRNEPGLLHARLQWRARKGDDAGVRELLLAAPVPVPYPEKWWKMREIQVRKAIDEQDYKLARRLLSNHGQTEGQGFADATWLSGWLSLRFLNDAEDAYRQFYAMHDAVKFAVSRARGAYWAGRAAEKMGDAESAKSWYQTAAAYPTSFYGQLAHAKTHGDAPLNLPSEPSPGSAEKQKFERRDLVRAIRLASSAGAYDTATALLYHLIDESDDAATVALAAQLGNDTKGAVLGVRGAKRALQKNIALARTGYPRLRLPATLPLEPALTLAIARQESEFDPTARSKSGALGLMQLLPGTGKDMAKKLDLAFKPARLYEPDYNLRLGSEYLSRLISGFDGSYLEAIAGYNAGPGRVREWIAGFGAPPHDVEGAIDWIEKIPYAETRNYVMRVIENLQLYRQISANNAPLKINDDLVR